MDDQIRRTMPLFSMSIVQKLTGLTARQIRYYEEHHLVQPERTEGNRRVFSFNDVEQLLEIKSLLDKGVNLAGIKHVLGMKTIEAMQPPVEKVAKKPEMSNADVMKYLKSELIQAGRHGKASLIQGELSRFFH
ncbi:MerR family glutamine synthetase transcriptional repressor [Scopulibacillus darangshiensis]|uniref:MerR family glutamine synthetase transcriptional repressor n=1 Tax=Scopulibacillus darangshiensis TaxID=442528 RepID=A0A4R2P6A1_9BACL|nr:MerR family transcriptional regulator [Scopulibacillus darangshiensis]TCP30247.1 MerR family glutamine synthetase transcriptional repressor [Scopulibacillus darangshiensis]